MVRRRAAPDNNDVVNTDRALRQGGEPSASDLRRWRRHLANERAEAAVYRDLALRYDGEEREILAAIAASEERHEQHWLALLGDQVGAPLRADFGTRTLAFLARHFGSVFVLALVQRFEARASYDDDADATPTMAASMTPGVRIDFGDVIGLVDSAAAPSQVGTTRDQTGLSLPHGHPESPSI